MTRSVTIPTSMRRALAELKAGPRNREASLGAILCPIATLEEWEAVAAPMQAALMRVSADDHAQAETVPTQGLPTEPLLSPVTHAKEMPTWIRS